MSESEQTNGSTLPTLARPSTDGAIPPDDRFDTSLALMRLLIGGMLVGADELRTRLRRWDVASRSVGYQAAPPQGSTSWLRFALVGMAFETENRMQRGFSRLRARLERLADDTNDAYTRFAYAVRGTPLDEVMQSLDDMFYRASRTIDEWVARGWIEEQQGRRIAEDVTVSVVDELLEYMAHNPEVRRLIEQQGMSMAESTADEVQERMASADQWVERLAHSLLRRPTSDKPANATANATPDVDASSHAVASTAPSSSGPG